MVYGESGTKRYAIRSYAEKKTQSEHTNERHTHIHIHMLCVHKVPFSDQMNK